MELFTVVSDSNSDEKIIFHGSVEVAKFSRSDLADVDEVAHYLNLRLLLKVDKAAPAFVSHLISLLENI